ncbi:phenylalanine--tRNA ligase subunit beta [Sulfurimonas paralvinellae]|uniref:Phenylalanine--tRNA ligase beta subunit n=1 Tax=Sulfurimonas paralvinellae TaxID=317658 RepID=A0A7M1B6V5_9BACT|nr:phenylalanine--tRNA ligase subunit beta [Sulfurimonas paralvinellae]QOP45467.1 phenylalanine--tRNA ligase subunit beta [Sulfurimonas paralvinellae]
MIVTRSWLQEWIDLEGISTEDVAKTFNAIGLEVDRVHEYRIPPKIVFGKVLECEKHPDADKLNICKVDIGSATRQIVCGAANVRAGLFVAVATIGAVMPDGMAIKPVKLRGIDSEGMICSSSELGLPDTGKGIMELDSSIGSFKLGEELSANPVFNDDLIEIELTANRGDCLSIRGVARDLSAAFDRPIKEYAVTDNDEKRGIGRILSLVHEKDLDVNLRYKALDLKDLSLPFIVKLRLAQIDESRVCDVESIMLYVTHATGVILRAYKHDFFTKEGEKLGKVMLDEDEHGFACIENQDKEIASIVGIIQNDESKMKEPTGTVVLEASYIPPDIISKKMAEVKIEAGPMFYKTSRGSEPELEGGLSYCIDLIEKFSNSTTFSGSIELSKNFKEKIVIISKQEIDAIIGAEIDKVVITKILKNLGFDTSKSSTDKFVITVPQFRHDIVNKQDIVEEIVRMVGIDNIPSKPFLLKEANRLEDNYFAYKKRSVYRHKCAQSGFYESIHFVFDEKKVLQSYGFETTKEELELLNPIVQTLDTLRPTLLTGLLKAASQNVKNGYASVRLFEIGSVFTPLREESLKMGLLFSGEKEKESLANSGKPAKVDFGYFVQKIADIIGDVELREYETTHTLSHIYQSAAVVQNGEVIGELFRVHPEVEKAYDLDVTYLCELDFEKLSYELKIAEKKSKYQASFRDLSLVMPKDMSYEKVKSVINANATEELIRFYPVDRYTDEVLGDNMSLSIRFVLQSDEKTLEEEDITSAMDKILEALNRELGIGLR